MRKSPSGVSFILLLYGKKCKVREVSAFQNFYNLFPFPVTRMQSYIITTRLQTKNGGEVVSIVIRHFDDQSHRERDLRELRDFAFDAGAELKVDELPRFSSESQ